MDFNPIAIIGQGCVLPGALTPDALWTLVREGRSAISQVPGGLWRLRSGIDRQELAREIVSDAGGYVKGFEGVHDPRGFLLAAETLEGLDPVVLWTLHAAREALRSAGLGIDHSLRRPGGLVVLGNLSYPTPALAELAVDIWKDGRPTVDPRNRFMSGLPAQLVAQAIGFDAGGFAIDAACASSLVAIKLACDRLQDGTAEIALAGGVNHADDLFLHLGFTALSALSPTGQSRPFHRDADGLVPAQGAALVVLKRLHDAEADGDRIFGVIRGVGLSNDGRSRGLLVPSEEGQIRAMKAAYATSGLAPSDISLIECHATGTAVGDATELRSLRAVFSGARDLPIGSLKSNLGHLITASGTAALIKVLGAIAAGVRPPTLHADPALDELATGRMRILHTAEKWTSEGPRRAAINNFGFGGNNAHLIVEEWSPGSARRATPRLPVQWEKAEIAVVAQAVTAGKASSAEEFEDALFAEDASAFANPNEASAADFELDAAGLRAPPADLREALAQQTLLLHAAHQLSKTIEGLPRERTGILIGMQCDAEVPRASLRWRQEGVLAGPFTEAPLTAAMAVGCMPNMAANRLSHQLDLRAPSFTISAEEASGTAALELAARALRAREIDAALVGAVDLSCEPVQRAAGLALLPEGRHAPGDAAVLLVLRRLDDARRDGDAVLAVLTAPTAADRGAALCLGPEDAGLSFRFGHAHAASGLLHVAAACAACARGVLPPQDGHAAMPWLPLGGERHACVEVTALGGYVTTTHLRADRQRPPQPRLREATPRLALFCASSVDGLLRALLRREPTEDTGAVRVAIVAPSEAELAARIARAADLLRSHSGAARTATLDEGIYFGAGPLEGELAFVFTGPAGAYPRMGRDLALALPELVDRLGARMSALREAAGWIYDEEPTFQAAPMQKLWGSSFLTQLHAELTRGLLGIRPHASIGYCSGETNALFALGAWSGLDEFRSAIDERGVYSRELCGELRSVRRAWGIPDDAEVGWSALRVQAPLDDVRAAVAGEPRVHLTIINGPGDAVIAGDPAGCARIAARLGAHRVRPLDYNFVMHCPEAREYASEWRELHKRPTLPVPGVRFYTHATLSSYETTEDAVADALLGQAMNPVDFPALCERAYADGVRVFVEHGPHAGCTKWIDGVLGRREHLAVALDRYGRSSLLQAVESAARLAAAGVPMNHRALAERLGPVASSEPRTAPTRRPLLLRLPAHLPPVRFARPIDEEEAQVMAPAPKLPPIASLLPLEDAAPTTVPTHRPAIASHHAQLAELHTAFLRQQSEVQARFVRMMLSAPWSVARTSVTQSPAPPPSALPAAPPPAPRVEQAVLPSGRRPTGPRFDRAQLGVLASGRISDVFGPLFRQQDSYTRQVRMPEPPLLLADRVLGIEGTPGEMGRGTIWTETDVTSDAWYLHEGRMPAGIFVESGQADLLLISWLGVDFLNRGERVYRLLGCDLVSHGELPRPGDTLTYEIHVDGHARQGDVRLFFFHYDCRINGELRMSVRNGQAGFFTDEELAASAGILWRPEEAQPTDGARHDPPPALCTKDHFTYEEISAFIDGRIPACFGPGFERAATHTRTPSIQGDRMRLVDDVTHFDRSGGPWGRGYLRARLALTEDHWFFRGHFKNDPCMPGTLMFEGCLQAMAIYLAALGHTLDRDGWRFEPVPEHDYHLRCRGQAVPTSKEVVYEVFVDEILDGPCPTLFADLLGTVDGMKAFHCRRMGLRLVPAWPLDEGRLSVPIPHDPRPVAKVDGFAFDYRSLLACAWGRPTEAFGPMYRAFDGTRRAPHLPGPPYHFMSRVARVEGPLGGMKTGSAVEVEYDVPRDAWYFEGNGCRRMPYAVLLEVALQPCGWLASYVGGACTSEVDLVFRNLDGTGTVEREVPDDVGTLTTRARLTSLSMAGGLIVVGFEATVRGRDTVIYSLKTVFGFFTTEAMRHQAGLPVSADTRARLVEESDARIELGDRPDRFFRGTLRLADGKLLMIDRITGIWPTGGKAGLGRIRAEKEVEAAEWFFKAHFFQDPVQPGSLGLEAMLQALQLLMIERGLGTRLESPRFEPIALGAPMTWRYRGQVVPENRLVIVDLDLTEIVDDERGCLALAEGSLWVDGKCIYSATGIGMRVIASERGSR